MKFYTVFRSCFLVFVVLLVINLTGISCSNPEISNPTNSDQPLSNNSNLESITFLGGVKLSPTFDNKVFDYSIDTSSDTKELRLIVVTEDEKSTVKINGTIATSEAVTKINIDKKIYVNIEVIAENNIDSKEFYIRIKRSGGTTSTTIKNSDTSTDTSVTSSTITSNTTTTVKNETTTTNSSSSTTTFSNNSTTTISSTTSTTNPITTTSTLATTTTLAPVTTTTTTIPYDGVKVHYKKPSGWAGAYIHYWSITATPAIPDSNWNSSPAMTDEGNGWYYYGFEKATAANMLFKDKSGDTGTKTSDLNKTTGEWWYKDGAWTSNNPEAQTTTTTTTTTIYNGPTTTISMSEDHDSLIIYQVMVESFQDGDPARDYNTGYGPSHHKGDLKGIKNALSYIKSLGANAIWMTPIFNSDGGGQLDATGYFAKNFFEIDPKFGSLQDAKDLVNEAHNLGMYVLLDGVFGHHKGGVPTSPSGNNVTGGNDPVSYPGSLNYFKEVATYWIDTLEIDGWRFDQAYQVSTKNQDKNYWKDIREAVEQKCAQRKASGKQWGTLGYMVGEIWDNETNIQNWGYNGGNGEAGLKSCFDFPLRYSLVQVLATQEHKEQSGAYGQSAERLNAGYNTHNTYSPFAKPNLMLTNHDLVRFGDLIQRAPNLGYGKENADYWKRHKAAFSFMTNYTGPITIYYGDEIGDEVPGFVNEGNGGYWDDHVSRSSGQISGFDSNQSDLKNYLTTLMTIRKSHKALWGGSRTNLIASGDKYADLKTNGSEKIVYCLNVGTSSTTITISQSQVGGTTLRDLVSGSTITASGGSYNISINGLEGKFLIVE